LSFSNKSINQNNYTYQNDPYQEDMVFTNYIKNRIDNKDPCQISIKQYGKYKSLLLAFEETTKCINNPDSSVISGNTGHHTKSTGFSVTNRNSVFNPNTTRNNNFYNKINNCYSNTTKEWNKNGKLFGNNANNNLNNKNLLGNGNGNNTNYNKSPEKLSKTSYNSNFNFRNNGVGKKIKLPDPQYNFNYQAKYFGVDENLDKQKNKKYDNFLLPLLKKKENNAENDFVPKTLLMELKQQRNDL